jgi:hypothetical protein
VVQANTQIAVNQTSPSGNTMDRLKESSRATGAEGLATRVATVSCGRLRPSRAMLATLSARTSARRKSVPVTASTVTTGLGFAVS